MVNSRSNLKAGRLICELFRKFASDRGSASIEFVGLALPLFIPLFIFINLYAHSSDAESSLRTVGREMARGFVTAENDEIAFAVADEIFVSTAEILGYSESLGSGDLLYSISCLRKPCITPNNQIEVTVELKSSETKIRTLEFVSPWA